jgi:hypothetical protein
MKLIRKGLALGVCAAAATIAACSSHHGPTGSSGSGSDQTATLGQGGGLGSIGMHLTLSNNDSIYSVSYTCTGPGTITPGTIDFNDAQSIEKVIGGIPAGNGYVCTLTGFDTLGDPCTGMTTSFNVSAGQVSSATAWIVCTQPTDAAIAADVSTGSVAIDAGITLVAAGANNCPGITSFSFSPAELIGSAQASQLALSEIGPQGLTSTGGALDAGAGITNILWTSSCAAGTGTLCGNFDGNATSTSPTPHFLCAGGAAPFQVTVTAQVTDYQTMTTPSGPVTTNVCNGVPYTSMSSLINCEGGGSFSCFNPTPNLCTGADGGPFCVNFSTDVNNCGSCGHVCATGNTCVSGACVAPPPTACTSSPCAGSGPNSVQCTGNAGQTVCTPTEAVVVARDISKGFLSGGQLTAASCYACLVSTGCIDGGGFGGNECGDLSGTITTGAAAGTTLTAACLNTLSCILPSSGTTCGNNASTGISNCFCGSNGGTASACTSLANFVEPPSGSGPNGSCDTQEFDGFGYASGGVTNTAVLGSFTTNTSASGMANAILSCAGTNSGSLASCPQCFQ